MTRSQVQVLDRPHFNSLSLGKLACAEFIEALSVNTNIIFFEQGKGSGKREFFRGGRLKPRGFKDPPAGGDVKCPGSPTMYFTYVLENKNRRGPRFKLA